MMKYRRRQGTDPQKFKKSCQRSFSRFLLMEAPGMALPSRLVEAVEK